MAAASPYVISIVVLLCLYNGGVLLDNFKTMKIRVFGILLPALLILLAIGYWFASNRVWFPFDERSVLVDGKSLIDDYVPVKSFAGDLFLRNQDHQTQYLISLKNREVSIISEDYNFVDIGILFTNKALAYENAPNFRNNLNTDLTIGTDFVEFTDVRGRRWRVPK